MSALFKSRKFDKSYCRKIEKLKSKIIYIAFLLLLKSALYAQDLTVPDTPVIDSVSVQWQAPTNPNGDVLISWQKCDSTDVRSYYIKYLNEILGAYKFLDSVDANTTSYLDSKVVTDPHYPQTYVVQAVDSSNNTSNHSEPHKTVRVFPWQKDENCETKVELTWNAYEGWDEGIAYYDLYSVKDGLTVYLGRFDDLTDLSFIYPLSGNSDYYEYYARVTSNYGRTSTSNKIPFTPDISTRPNFINFENITVDGNQIKLQFNLDSVADINNYHLMRSCDSLTNFSALMQFNNYNKSILDIVDANVEVGAHRYFYRLNLYNDCFDLLDSSQILSSILLKGRKINNDYSQILKWSQFYDGIASDKNYKLYRYSELGLPQIINNTSYDYQYIDNLTNQNFESFVGDFCYYISVDRGTTNSNISQSNIVCISQDPSVQMPTAFAPNGFSENRIFKPSFAFISSERYYFAVFDRWGNKIFETSDFKEGWTGKKNGLLYKNGTYTYYLMYYSSVGEKFEESGSFNLIN